MSDRPRPADRRLPLQAESLETRALLSLLINSKPTLDIQANGPGVRRNPGGSYSIIQPVTFKVFGTAQPPINLDATVSIYAEDRNGNLVNGGQPLAVATPDFLGRYSARVSLPSTIRKDVNQLVAFETVNGAINANLTINPTTVSGIVGTSTVNGTTLRNFAGQVNIVPGTVGGITATVANPNGTISALSGPITIAPGTTIGGITSAVNTAAGTTLTLANGRSPRRARRSPCPAARRRPTRAPRSRASPARSPSRPARPST